MKIKTSDLTGAALDWAVAKCEGLNPNTDPKVRIQYVGYAGFAEANGFGYAIKNYSTDWGQGGPLLDKLLSAEAWTALGHVHGDDVGCTAQHITADNKLWACGGTALVTICRLYVASKLGDEVEVPDELAQT